MILTIFQIAMVGSVAAYLVYRRKAAKRCAARTCETLLAELRSDWSAHDLSKSFLWKEGLDATPEDAWLRMDGARGLWAMFQNARVMMEMADYASNHYEGVDRLLVETLHSDAMQIRVCVLAALSQYAFTQASEGVRVNAYRAAAHYTGMAARMTQLLQNHAGSMVPAFVAAM